MPAPRTVAASLKRTATQLAKIPDVAIGDVATDIVETAVDVGGTMTRRRYPLIAEARVRGGKRTRTAEIFGRPAGLWSIRTYGRDAIRVRRRQRGTARLKGFRIGGRYATTAGPAGPVPSRSWDRVVDHANETAGELVARAVAEAVT